MTIKISLPLRAEPVNPGRINDDKDWLIRDSTDRIIARVPDKSTAAQLVAMAEDAKRLEMENNTLKELIALKVNNCQQERAKAALAAGGEKRDCDY